MANYAVTRISKPHDSDCGYNAVWFGDGTTVRKNISPPSSWSKSNRNKNPAEADGRIMLLTGTTKNAVLFTTRDDFK
jgi:hypothetical protein